MSNSEISDGKIHILYLVKHAPGVSYQMLMDKCLESLYLDFFTFSKCYTELIAGNLLDKEIGDTGTGEVVGTNETIKITRGGKAILEDIESTLNLQTLGYLKKAASELNEEVRKTNSVKAFSAPSPDGDGMRTVSLSTTENGMDFNCSFKASAEQADKIVASWRNNSAAAVEVFLANLLNSDSE